MKLLVNAYWLLLACCFACGEEEKETPVLTSLTIVESPFKLDLNETVKLTLKGSDQNGSEIAITDEVLWSSSESNASIDQSGSVTGQVEGDVTITASVDDIAASIDIRIWDSTAPRTEIYVTDAARFNNGGPYKVIRYDEDGGFAETLIDSNLGWPQDIVFLEDKGTMLVSNLSTNSIEKFDINTGAHKGAFAAISNGPTRMKIGPDNLLYVLQWNNSSGVLRFDLDGNFIDTFTSVGINQAIGMDWDSNGNFYVSSFQGTVKKFDSEGNDLGVFISSNIQGPTNIYITEDNEMLVLDWKAGTIQKFDLDGSFVGTFATGLSQPEGIERMPDGKFLIGNGQAATISVFTSEGVPEGNLFSGGFGSLIQPNGVIIRLVNY
ncbi:MULTISPECIES: Ig-like domain-containing protein [unclassified Ekhidna]|uniref:Ig-like domain-containing protein n=1 Tax=unclassified Ekhidna TaxID=2632188 RepID=UPI0032DE3560